MRRAKRKVGFIGLDVGTATLKVAQVQHGQNGWQLAASAVLPRQQCLEVSSDAVDNAPSALDELQIIRSLDQPYRGRRVAAALPIAVCDLHRLNGDLQRDPNREAVLQRTIETATQQSAESLLCDYWTGPATDAVPAWTQAMTAPISWLDQVCEDVAKVGWTCDAIDGLPLAMTRAVNMIHNGQEGEPVAALDWGASQATLCLVEAGRATYTRKVKLRGLSDILQEIAESLHCTEAEAQGLIEQFGVTGMSDGQLGDVAAMVKGTLLEVVETLEEELRRSLSHFQFLRRAKSPQRLYLMGGGAMIKGLDQRLTERMDFDATNWQLSTDDQPSDSVERRLESVLATSIALSALAWEVA